MRALTYCHLCHDAAVDRCPAGGACYSYYNAEGTAKDQDLPYSAPTETYFGQLRAAQEGRATAFDVRGAE